MSETKKPTLAIGQKWRTKNGQTCIVTTEFERQGDTQTFGVDSNSLAYWPDGKAYTNPSKGEHVEEDELVELIHQPVKEAKQSTFEVRAEFPATEPPKFPKRWDNQTKEIKIHIDRFHHGRAHTLEAVALGISELAFRDGSDLAFRDGVKAGIAYERERCIGVCQAMRPPGGRAWTPEQSACFDALSAAAENIRTGMDPWAGGPERVKQEALEALEEAVELLRDGEPMRPNDLKETYAKIKAGLDLAP